MSDTYTDGGTQWANLLATGYDRFLEYQLRANPIFRQLVDKHPVDLTNVGPSVTLTVIQDYTALATTALTETASPSLTAPPAPDRVTINVHEYGMAEAATLRLKQLAFTPPDPAIANVLGYNMVRTLDKLAQNQFDAATHVIGKNNAVLATDASGTAYSADSVKSTDKLDSTTIRAANALLRSRNVHGRDSADNFLGVIHPDVAVDVMSDTGWLSPHQYVDTSNIYNAEIGSYLGVRFMQSPLCTVTANGATPSVNVYNTYIVGAQALAEVVIAREHVVVGPQIDPLRRFFPLGWLYHGGFGVYREEAIEICGSSSSVDGLA